MTVNVKFERGLIAAIKNSDDGNGYYSSGYTEVFYNVDNSECWGVYQYSVGRNTWTNYHDDAIVKIGNYSGKVTKRELLEDITRKVDYLHKTRSFDN